MFQIAFMNYDGERGELGEIIEIKNPWKHEPQRLVPAVTEVDCCIRRHCGGIHLDLKIGQIRFTYQLVLGFFR